MRLNPIPTGGVGELEGVTVTVTEVSRLNPIPTGGVGERSAVMRSISRHESQSHPHRRGG